MNKQRCAPDTERVAAAGTIVVQAIRVAWTKATRGSQGGTVRNSLPRALPLPEAIPPSSEPAYFTNLVIYDEEDAFRCKVNNMSSGRLADVLGTYKLDDEPEGYWRITDWDIGLLPLGNTVRVDLWWTHGMPWRKPIQGLFNVKPGQWACLRFNWRTTATYFGANEYDEHHSGSDWPYRQLTVNIGFFSSPPQDVFVVTKPSYRHVDMARLW